MGDEGFFFFEAGFLFFVGAELDHAAFDALLSERGVVAGVLDQSGLFDLNDTVDDAIEHVAVVADEDDGAFELVAKEAFEPLSALDVEVIGGFVEEEDGGVLEEEFAEGDAGFLAAGEVGDFDVELCVGEAQTMEDLIDFVVVDEPALGVDLVFDLGLFFEELIEFFGAGVAHRVEDVVEFGVEFFDVIECTGDGLAEGVVWVEIWILVEVSDGGFAGGDGAVCWLEDTGNDFDECGFSAAVAADNADAFGGFEGQ